VSHDRRTAGRGRIDEAVRARLRESDEAFEAELEARGVRAPSGSGEAALDETSGPVEEPTTHD
jgi:hypothetical protein